MSEHHRPSRPVRRPFPELPGRWEISTAPDVLRDGVWFRVDQDLGSRKVAGTIAMTNELLRDVDVGGTVGGISEVIEAGLDRVFRPWRYPDPPIIPRLDVLGLDPWRDRARAFRRAVDSAVGTAIIRTRIYRALRR